MARDSNGYNDSALVNLGNCCFKRKDYEKAREHYIAALDIDASCVEALYNLGKNCRVKSISFVEILFTDFYMYIIAINGV